MAIDNTSGYIDILANSGESAATVFAMNTPLISTVAQSSLVFMAVSIFLGVLLGKMGAPLGITTLQSIREHLALSIFSLGMLFPMKTVSIEELVGSNNSPSETYSIGYGPYIIMKTVPFFFDWVSGIVVYIADDTDDSMKSDFVAANTIMLKEMADGEALKHLPGAFQSSMITARQVFVSTCNDALSRFESNPTTAQIDPSTISTTEWNAFGLKGGMTLGLTDNIDELERLIEENQEVKEPGVFASLFGISTSPERLDPNLSNIITILSDIRFDSPIYGPDGLVITYSMMYEGESGKPNKLEVLKPSDINGYEYSVQNGGYYDENKTPNTAWFRENLSDNAVNAYDCYTAYLIANAAMKKGNEFMYAVYGKKTTSATSLFTASFSGSEFDYLKDKIDGAKDRSFFTLTAMSNEALQMSYQNAEATDPEKDDESKSYFERYLEVRDSVGDFIKRIANTGAITAVEGKALLERSYAQDVSLPVAYAGALMAMAFMLIIAPIVVMTSSIMPLGSEATTAYLKIIIFFVVFITILSVGLGTYEVVSESVFQAFTANMSYNATSPSAQLASMTKALQWMGMTIVAIAAGLAFLIVFGRPPRMSFPSSSVKINMPKSRGPKGSSGDDGNANIDTNFNLGKTPPQGLPPGSGEDRPLLGSGPLALPPSSRPPGSPVSPNQPKALPPSSNSITNQGIQNGFLDTKFLSEKEMLSTLESKSNKEETSEAKQMEEKPAAGSSQITSEVNSITDAEDTSPNQSIDSLIAEVPNYIEGSGSFDEGDASFGTTYNDPINPNPYEYNEPLPTGFDDTYDQFVEENFTRLDHPDAFVEDSFTSNPFDDNLPSFDDDPWKDY